MNLSPPTHSLFATNDESRCRKRCARCSRRNRLVHLAQAVVDRLVVTMAAGGRELHLFDIVFQADVARRRANATREPVLT